MDRYIIDANVVLLAGTPVGDIPDDQVQCALKCVTFIHNFMNNQESRIVLDSAGEILKEKKSGGSPIWLLNFINGYPGILRRIPWTLSI